jgi:DNA-directed RNA polymerase specialized sigma24 family protein
MSDVREGRQGREAVEPGDEDLVREIVARSPQALTALYRRYAPLVFHIACQSLDTAGAEEIVQDVFLTVWQKAETFDPAGALSAPGCCRSPTTES